LYLNKAQIKYLFEFPLRIVLELHHQLQRFGRNIFGVELDDPLDEVISDENAANRKPNNRCRRGKKN